jgi:hypothetical protein
MGPDLGDHALLFLDHGVNVMNSESYLFDGLNRIRKWADFKLRAITFQGKGSGMSLANIAAKAKRLQAC